MRNSTPCSITAMSEINNHSRSKIVPQLIHLEMDSASPPALFDLLKMIIGWATEMTGAKAAEIFLWDSETEELVLSVSNGFLEPFIGTRLKPGEGISGRAFQLDESLIVEDYNNWEGKPAAFTDHPADMDVLAVPMRWQDRIIGVLVVDTDNRVKRFSDSDVRMIKIFANVASAAILYERYYRNLEKNSNSIEILTPRESEIFQLLLEGLSNPEIAERLVISRATVKTHVSRILEKMGVENRMELMKKFSHLVSSKDETPKI
jgi:DNA-binding CsgD family transcriptional regulator/putative methionine-R-sulfoxide reductase with GAF domain